MSLLMFGAAVAPDSDEHLQTMQASAEMPSLTVGVGVAAAVMTASAALLDLEVEQYFVWGDMRRELDPADWPGTPVVAYLEVHARMPGATPYKARFYNETVDAVVPGSDVATSSPTTERVRSGPFSLAAGPNVYHVEFLPASSMADAVVIVDAG